MSSKLKNTWIAAGVAALLCATALPAALAQETSKGSVVVYPVIFTHHNGSKGGRETGVRAVREMLQKAGFTLISDTVAANTWQRLHLPRPTPINSSRVEDLVQFGKAVRARYVVTPTFYFHSRSIWVDLGPRTVSTATVGLVIADVDSGTIVYQKADIEGRSDEEFNLVKAGADILLTPLVTVVSGGPKTPHEQRAVQIAVIKALRGWVRPGE